MGGRKKKDSNDLLVPLALFVIECSPKGVANPKRKHVRHERAPVGTLCELAQISKRGNRMTKYFQCFLGTLVFLAPICGLKATGQESQQKVDIDWEKTIIVSKSTPTLQVVTNPMLNPGSPIHDGSFSALKALGADYVRYVPWLPYPKIAVAELEPPTKEKTSWDFTYIDPVTKDLLAATEGHSTIINFSTIPAWMFKTDQPVKYPDDPNQLFWDYTKGIELRGPRGKELGDDPGRLVSWYTQGGFTDENGKRHESGYHYPFPYWEILNEIESEHSTTPE